MANRRKPDRTDDRLSQVRSAAGHKGLSSRWGQKRRPPHRRICVDPAAAEALATVRERDRRQVATTGVFAAVRKYHARKGSSSPRA